VPGKTGEFKTSEIRVAYLNPETTAPTETAAHGTVPSDSGASPSLRADPFNIVVWPDRSSVRIFGGLGASLLVLGVGWWFARRWRYRRPSASPTPVPAIDLPAVQEALHRARQRRLDGNFYEFYTELSQAAALPPLADKYPGLADLLKGRAQEVGYKGVRPTDDQMAGDFGDVERALARYKEEVQV